MRIGGRTTVVVFCGLLALALVAGAGAAGKAFAHRDRGRSCDCCCGKGGCCDRGPGDCDCGQMHGKSPMPPTMEGMKGHLEDVRKRVEALRKSEKALSGITDQAAFRTAVVEHLKLVDDLQEAHARHMESMPGKMMGGEKAGGPTPCSQPCSQPCPQPCSPPCPQEKTPSPPAAR